MELYILLLLRNTQTARVYVARSAQTGRGREAYGCRKTTLVSLWKIRREKRACFPSRLRGLRNFPSRSEYPIEGILFIFALMGTLLSLNIGGRLGCKYDFRGISGDVPT